MIRAIPAFADNYIWIIENERESPGVAAVVDPGQAEPVLDALAQHGLALGAILITHHHADHTGGIADLVQNAPWHNEQVPLVFGPANEPIAELTCRLSEGDVVEIAALNARFSVIELPGHTKGHIAYFGFCNSARPVLFCGDTLFAAGCGRLFEGSPEQMWNSLQKLAKLPAETAVYCAHEYTLSNLRFARHAFSQNKAIEARFETVSELRAEHRITLPSSIAEELLTNPFLLCSSAAEFAQLRKLKDEFRG
jgi:hydroxyacylglutathione hydrolase